MKKLAFPTFVALSVALASCGGEAEVTETPGDTSNEMATIDLAFMDTTIDPAQDFYHYCNGTWIKENPVPSTESSWGSFNELDERNKKLLQDILKEASTGEFEKGSHMQMIGDFYATVMDSTSRDEQGFQPIAGELEKINAIASKEDLLSVVADHHMYQIGSIFETGVLEDLKDNTKYAMYASQAGIGLPSKDYYFKDDEKSEEIRQKYVEHMGKMFQLLGHDEATASAAANKIMEIETQLAEASMGPVELRNIEIQYNKMTMDELAGICPSNDWNGYFEKIGVGNLEYLIVTQPEFFKRVDEVLNSVSIDDWKTYLTWRLIDETAGYLSTDFENQNFWFFGTVLSGTKEMKPRWKRAISAVGAYTGEPLGRAFVDKAFSPESKQRVNEMVDNLFAAFEMRLEQVDWMTDSTKELAKAKLATFTRKLGYPDEWTDFSDLEISRESYAMNALRARNWQVKDNLAKMGQPVDKTEWGMAPHIVNAYYNPLINEIVFPAGIMQPPFFVPDAEDAVNYARMGAVIGHEFTHGFDDMGSQFDATGNFNNWWSAADREEFTKRTTKLVEHFNSFEAMDSLYVNGELTLGENIADLGGLTLAYYAYQKSLEGKEREDISGFTPEQRFFIAFGQIWKVNYTDESLRQQVMTNPHSPGNFRVIGPLSNMPEFFEAFDVQEGDAMRRGEDVIARIW